jgi:uncharacterized membrane protein YfcA
MSAPSIPMISSLALPVLFGTGLVAGFVDSIAGGGGLITLPVLLSLGIPPTYALGTNKLQATFGSGSAAWHHIRSKTVSLSDCGVGVLFTILGATAGTLLVQKINPSFLKQFIPVLLVLIAVYVLVKPQLGAKDLHPRISPVVFHVVLGLLLGFYDGFLGPGTGTFWTMAYMLGLGFNLTKATGHTKVMNFASNIASLLFFALSGKVLYAAGLSMGAGQLIGAKIGSGMVITKGAKFIRPIFIAMVLAITLKLLYEVYAR